MPKKSKKVRDLEAQVKSLRRANREKDKRLKAYKEGYADGIQARKDAEK